MVNTVTRAVVLKFELYQNHQEDLATDLIKVHGKTWNFAFLKSSQVMVMLLVQEPHFENHQTRESHE